MNSVALCSVDFYSGIIYQAMGFKPEMFTVRFTIPHTVGWLAQWQEMLADPEQKIARPADLHRSRSARILADGKPQSGGGRP
jgi:citrate synthase